MSCSIESPRGEAVADDIAVNAGEGSAVDIAIAAARTANPSVGIANTWSGNQEFAGIAPSARAMKYTPSWTAQATAPSAAESISGDQSSSMHIDSEVRDPERDWTEYFPNRRIMSNSRTLTPSGTTSANCVSTVEKSMTSVDCANFSCVPVLSDSDIWELFKSARDTRYLEKEYGSINVRRSSWLYPYDGCALRAALLVQMAVDLGMVTPYKLFVFGNLKVTTPYDSRGFVTWNFHVAPIVKSASSGQVLVLDPALSPSQPLPWKTWILKQAPSTSGVCVTVADSGAEGPESLVSGEALPNVFFMRRQMRQTLLTTEWRNLADLGFDPVVLLGFSPPWANVGKDLNRDRKRDMLWHNGATGATQVWYMNNTSRTGYAYVDPSHPVKNSTGFRFAGTGDFDRDGKADIVWYNASIGSIRVWFMDGLTMTKIGVVSSAVSEGTGWTLRGMDDFNYDGKPELLLQNRTTGALQLWVLDEGLNVLSFGPIASPRAEPDASDWRFAATGDFNRDGAIELLWHNGISGASELWFLNSDLSFDRSEDLDPRYLVPDSTGWRFFALGDFNYDGSTDILWHNGTTGATQAWYMDGLTRISYASVPYNVTDPNWTGAGY